jgi:hypothetical protein
VISDTPGWMSDQSERRRLIPAARSHIVITATQYRPAAGGALANVRGVIAGGCNFGQLP